MRGGWKPGATEGCGDKAIVETVYLTDPKEGYPMTLVLKPKKGKDLRDQFLTVLALRQERTTKHWETYFGKFNKAIDPVAYQRSLRDE